MEERLFAKVDMSGECWLWGGGCNGKGYGIIDNATANSVAFSLRYGPIPPGHVAGHTCDTPRCVRNDGPLGTYEVAGEQFPRYGHLFLATKRANSRDMVDKGRSTFGERDPGVRLDADAVRAIRARYAAGGVQQKALAAEFGISKGTVSDILRRRSWAHL